MRCFGNLVLQPISFTKSSGRPLNLHIFGTEVLHTARAFQSLRLQISLKLASPLLKTNFFPELQLLCSVFNGAEREKILHIGPIMYYHAHWCSEAPIPKVLHPWWLQLGHIIQFLFSDCSFSAVYLNGLSSFSRVDMTSLAQKIP